MTYRTNHLPEDLYAYLLDVSLREPPVMRRLREETASLEKANMQIGPPHGSQMALRLALLSVQGLSRAPTNAIPGWSRSNHWVVPR